MKCIKCGYTSFDHLSECKKCGTNLSDARESLNLPAMEPSVPFLLGALLDGRESTGSGEQESAAVEAQADVIESIEMLSLDSPETEEASADAAEAIELELSEEDLEGLVLELGDDLEEAEPDPEE
jgi:predicted  nucleic acid-binding Zn-ribbon protein